MFFYIIIATLLICLFPENPEYKSINNNLCNPNKDTELVNIKETSSQEFESIGTILKEMEVSKIKSSCCTTNKIIK